MADTANTKKQIMSLVATSSSRIRDLVIKDGQLIFIQDLGRIAFDFKGNRVFYNQIVKLDTDLERINLESPLSGYYFVIDTACLWFYQDDWIQITEKPQEIIFIGIELPALGQQGKLYVNVGNKEISAWDEKTNKYMTVSNYIEEVSSQDIEGLFD